MKKLLLSSFSVAMLALSANAQYHEESYDAGAGVTPCFLGYEGGPGAFQGFAGHDFSNMTWDQANGALTFSATTHASSHGPLYYTLSGGDAVNCLPGAGLADISASKKLVIRAKATTPFTINVYVQEGNAASWDYSKFSETALKMALTTEYQEFTLTDISAVSLSAGTVDLSKIGNIAFELGKTNGTSFDQVSGATVSVDYIKLGAKTGTEEVASSSVAVYPNPASDVVNVSVASAATVELVDVTGAVVASEVASSASTVQLSTAGLSAGLYVVSVKSANGTSTQKVAVK